MKKCSNCGIEKPLEEFGNRKKAHDGKQSYCKKCMREKSKKWKEENKDKYLEKQMVSARERRKNDEGYRLRQKEFKRNYHLENRETIIAKMKKDYWYSEMQSCCLQQ